MVHAFVVIERQLVTLLDRHDMTLPQFDVLATLLFSEGVTQQELAKRLLVTKGNVVGLLNRLETAGWVTRRPDPVDARANRLYLTVNGRRTVEKVLPDHDALIERLFGCLSDDAVTTLRQCFVRLRETCE